MAQTALIQVRVDEEFKKEMDSLFADLGFDTPTAIRMFLKQAARRRGLPFEVNQFNPNPETITAMEEADRISMDPTVKGYTDVDEMMRELLTNV